MVRQVVAVDDNLGMDAAGCGPPGRCPQCERPATRVHRRYRRRIAGLPVGGHTMMVRLSVRRFSCDQRHRRRPGRPPSSTATAFMADRRDRAPRTLGIDEFAFRRVGHTERSSWTSRRPGRSTCCLIVRPARSPPGSLSTPAQKSCAMTG
ncbi:transposase family protein [Streptomyces sp. NPDC059627]